MVRGLLRTLFGEKIILRFFADFNLYTKRDGDFGVNFLLLLLLNSMGLKFQRPLKIMKIRREFFCYKKSSLLENFFWQNFWKSGRSD